MPVLEARDQAPAYADMLGVVLDLPGELRELGANGLPVNLLLAEQRACLLFTLVEQERDVLLVVGCQAGWTCTEEQERSKPKEGDQTEAAGAHTWEGTGGWRQT